MRTLAEHLASWGGRPLLCVFDRPKTIALKWRKNGEVTEWNPVFAYATLEMGVGVELCWPYRAQQKGSVENLVGFVKSSFFKVRRFHDEQDLRQQLRDWHREVNEERPCRATGIIPAVRLAEETRVRIVAGRYEAEHPRKFAAHEGSSLAEHRAAMVAAVCRVYRIRLVQLWRCARAPFAKRGRFQQSRRTSRFRRFLHGERRFRGEVYFQPACDLRYP